MSRELVIFGSGDIAQLAHYYFTEDSDYNVVAFTVDSTFIKEETFCGLPVVPFEKITQSHPVDKYSIFIALSYSKLNQIRKEKYLIAKRYGYQFATYISSYATVLNRKNIGENCFILEDNTIQPFVTIGNNVSLWSGNHIGHHSHIGNHCFLASHIVVSGGVRIGEQCFIGVNATLRDHIDVADKTVVGAGVLLMSSTEAGSVYIGTKTEPASVSSDKLRKL